MIKKAINIVLFFAAMIALTGCYEGYISSEAAKPLKEFLEPEKLKELTDNPRDSIFIIDVRPKERYNSGHIPTARSFPSSEITGRLDELPQSKYYIIYCETGGRAQSVIKKLESESYTKMMNWGGYSRWPYKGE
jgi:rhodanese-related sulfurtransferase